MRRLAALLAAVLAVACHSRDDRDTTPPGVPAILAPVEGDVLGTAELVAGEVVLSGTAEAGALVTLELDGVVATTASAGGGAWSVAATLPDGSHTARARASDGSGNSSAFSAARGFAVDTLHPATPAITAPANDTLTSAASLTVTGTAPSDAALVRVLDATTVVATGAPSGGTFALVVTPAEGAHVYTAVAVDTAGNVSPPSPVVTVTVDRTAPAIPVVLAPPDGDSWPRPSSSRARSSSPAPPSAGALVTLEVDGGVAATTIARARRRLVRRGDAAGRVAHRARPRPRRPPGTRPRSPRRWASRWTPCARRAPPSPRPRPTRSPTRRASR